ncbi:MAG: zinc ribbon domain-containing protein, partial [Thermoplasmata archaeon]
EKHPEAAAQVSAAMEKLELARDFIKEGDGEAAMQFAMEAKGALKEARVVSSSPEIAGTGAAAPTTAKKGSKEKVGGLRCPSCGEGLQPEWTVCPACGHGTR